MNALSELKGQNGKLLVHDKFVVISRDTFGGLISQGFTGERKYFFEDIRSVEYRKPTLMANGYLKLIVSGTEETNAKVGLFSSSMKSMKDQNTIVLRSFSGQKGEESDKFYGLLMEKISHSKSKRSTAIPSGSRMDELKKLGELRDSGILTEEEFQMEKRKLLNS